MSTLRQIEANRQNSQLSTGPRTPEGKSVSRFNALKSGINCQAQIIPGEDPADLQAMTDGYHHDCVPTTWMERALVDRLIRADWLLQRLSRLEAEMWIHEMESARKMTFSKWMKMLRLATSTAASATASPVSSAASIPPSAPTTGPLLSCSASAPVPTPPPSHSPSTRCP